MRRLELYVAGHLAVLVTLTACGVGVDSVGRIDIAESDSAGVTVLTVSGAPEALPTWELEPEPVAIVSGTAAPFLGDVGEVALRADGRLIVEDDRAGSLHLFGPTGRLERTLGERGDGPGEFRNVTEISVAAGDTAHVFDRRNRRVSVFDPSGDLVRVVSVEGDAGGPGSFAFDVWALGSTGFLLHSLGPVPEAEGGRIPRLGQRPSALRRLDGNGRAIGEPRWFVGAYTIIGQLFDGRAPFVNDPVVGARPGRVVWGSGVDYELFIGTEDGRPHHLVRWPEWRQPLTPELVDSVREVVAAGMEPLRLARPEAYAARLDALFDPALLPTLLPALDRVLLDDRGRIWVSRFRPGSERWDETDRWHVLTSDGRPIARLALPANTRLVAIRGDRVAVAVRGELDVQEVEVLDIGREDAG